MLINDYQEEKNCDLRKNNYKEKDFSCEGDSVGTSSVNGRTWKMKMSQKKIGDINIQDVTVPEVVTEMISRRGVEDIENWIEPSFKHFMPNPSLLTNMDKAVSILCEAVEKKQKIGIVGDYDVDGATSTAIMIRYFRELGMIDVDGALTKGNPDGSNKEVIDPDKDKKNVMFHIPQRMSEGYGTSEYAVNKMKKWGADILLILDSGTLSFDMITLAKSKGMKVVVVDHHDPKEKENNGQKYNELPNADALINPKLLNDQANLSHLCTAGLAFMVVVAMNRQLKNDNYFTRNNMQPVPIQMLLGLTALGTVADVMQLKTLNRAFVAMGMKYMQYVPGIVALHDILNTKQKEKYGIDKDGNAKYGVKYDENACGFSFGPCINACGRISDSSLGTRLLVSEDIDEINELANLMYETNENRKAQEKQIRESCEDTLMEREKELKRLGEPEDNVLILYGKDWHPGVVGIVASRIKDKYFKPTVIIGQSGRGSARSFSTFNIGHAFHEAAEEGLIEGGGGHMVAAGLSLFSEKKIIEDLENSGLTPTESLIDLEINERLRKFRNFMNKKAENFIVPDTHVDLVIPACELTVKDVEAFDLMAPFGEGNRPPEVLLTNAYVADIMAGGGNSVRGKIKDDDVEISFINFNIKDTDLGQTLRKSLGFYVKIKGVLEINHYGGRKKIQMKVNDIEICEKNKNFVYHNQEISDQSFI